MYYIISVSLEMPNTHTIDMYHMVSLSVYSIFVEYPIYCTLNITLAAPSIYLVIFHILDQHAFPG